MHNLARIRSMSDLLDEADRVGEDLVARALGAHGRLQPRPVLERAASRWRWSSFSSLDAGLYGATHGAGRVVGALSAGPRGRSARRASVGEAEPCECLCWAARCSSVAIVEAALVRDHEVTLFTRGRHNPDLFPDCEHLRGDRDGALEALRGSVDAVVDTSGYVPRIVRASAELLAEAVAHYTFAISSISVYADLDRPGADESAPVGALADPTVEEVTGETYGPQGAV
ncbi:MAG: hypothetical protein U0531_01075 [Dehalococcoidia bacterium]